MSLWKCHLLKADVCTFSSSTLEQIQASKFIGSTSPAIQSQLAGVILVLSPVIQGLPSMCFKQLDLLTLSCSFLVFFSKLVVS